MVKIMNREMDWIGALSVLCGAVVVAASLIALFISLFAVAATVF